MIFCLGLFLKLLVVVDLVGLSCQCFLSFFGTPPRNVWVLSDVTLRGLQDMIQVRELDFFAEGISDHLSSGHPSNTFSIGVVQVA